jgi:hypothetical protein
MENARTGHQPKMYRFTTFYVPWAEIGPPARTRRNSRALHDHAGCRGRGIHGLSVHSGHSYRPKQFRPNLVPHRPSKGSGALIVNERTRRELIEEFEQYIDKPGEGEPKPEWKTSDLFKGPTPIDHLPKWQREKLTEHRQQRSSLKVEVGRGVWTRAPDRSLVTELELYWALVSSSKNDKIGFGVYSKKSGQMAHLCLDYDTEKQAMDSAVAWMRHGKRRASSNDRYFPSFRSSECQASIVPWVIAGIFSVGVLRSLNQLGATGGKLR